jgi:PqqD family protein of HPr-rel-A system
VRRVVDARSERSSQVHIAAVAGLRLRHFGDEAVVFDPVSWDAHLLNPAAIAVLELLLDSPHSEAEVVAFLANALHPDEQPHAAGHGKRLIEDLRSLALVRPVEIIASANC